MPCGGLLLGHFGFDDSDDGVDVAEATSLDDCFDSNDDDDDVDDAGNDDDDDDDDDGDDDDDDDDDAGNDDDDDDDDDCNSLARSPASSRTSACTARRIRCRACSLLR